VHDCRGTRLGMTRICRVLLVALVAPSTAQAGAWTQATDETIVISKLTVTTAPQAFAVTGEAQEGASFSKTEVETYLEYGWRETVTLIGRVNWQDTIAGSDRQTGFTAFEVGARTRFWRFTNGSVFSAQASIIFPGRRYDRNTPLLTSGNTDYDIRLLQGVPTTFFGFSGFSDFQLAYRYRTGNAPNEARFDATLGIHAAPNWLVLLQSFNINSVGGAEPPFTAYRSNKLQGSIRWQFARGRFVEIGGVRTIAGVQTVRETGGLISFWATF